jgi:tRNA A-37 threonylcarbamoyl transferase component Bud32
MSADRTGQTLLGKYLLHGRIGKGGMGEVWEAEHALTGRRVAVKILGEAHLSNAKIVARFGREARAASAVQHPGIVEILDQDVTPAGEPFLVMEFLAGESLGERIKRKGKLSEGELIGIALPLLDALHAAHLAGVVHRDLKPDNIFLVPRERGKEQVKILDFGISRKADELAHHLTQEGSVLGTPHYMSPEQARGEVDVDGRADVYAMGVLLYEAATGRVPFDAKNYNALLQRILGEEPASPRSRGAEISPAVERVILSAMAKTKAKRPNGAEALKIALRQAADAPALVEAGALLPVTVEVPRAAVGHDTPTVAGASLRTLAVDGAADLGLVTLPGVAARSDEFDRALSPLGDSASQTVLPLGTSGVRGVGPSAPSVRPPPPRVDSAPPEPRVEVQAVARAPHGRGAAVMAGGAASRSIRDQRGPDRSERAASRPPTQALKSVARGALGWLMAAVAIAFLAYTGRLVFRRPDARHAPRALAPLEQGEPSSAPVASENHAPAQP